MANMSYCRFQNTAQDLQDCRNNFTDDLGGEEFKARQNIIELAQRIVDSYGEEPFIDYDEEEDEDE